MYFNDCIYLSFRNNRNGTEEEIFTGSMEDITVIHCRAFLIGAFSDTGLKRKTNRS